MDGIKGNDACTHELTNQLAGPIIFDYVWWVLLQAEKRSITTVYFLARDGYLLYRIACKLCDKFRLAIKCRYLYCSRAALRMPTYHLIGEEALELLLLGGYHVTLRLLMQRGELSKAERQSVYSECGLTDFDDERILNRSEFKSVCDKLRSSKIFHQLICKKSKEAYPMAIGYLREEGLFEQSHVAIVDSGWTGSMQRSLRQLLQSGGFQGEITGFYYGMYAKPKDPADGTYLTWYFNHSSSPWIKIPFCNNLFECLLAAPHGMTTGYLKQDEKYVPIMLKAPEGEELKRIEMYMDSVLQYAEDQLKDLEYSSFAATAHWKDTYRRIRRYMASPRQEEAEHWGKMYFCDDVTEAYHFALASAEQVQYLRGYSIPARVWRRFFSHKTIQVNELFWPFGTIAFLPWWQRGWYRINIVVWEWLRYVRT